jgi:acetoin utilization deacetylase AcuC-like enzyme
LEIVTTAYITHTRYPEHNLPGHPEHAGRIQAVWQKLQDTGLAARMNNLEAPLVSEELILAVHTPKYLETLNWIASTNQHNIRLDPDTYAAPVSYEIARLSAGGVVLAVDEVLTGRAVNALAAVRPPGHHAMPGHGMGFCLLGNVAIAARHAQRAYGINRVMIVDYDVHHGNGTQAMFYDDDTVLFISTHQSPFYPGTGHAHETGKDKGKGFTLNVPLPGGQGDSNYAAVFEQIIWPAAERFQPQFIVVSAGFDAHWTDPLAAMRLSLKGYAHLTKELIMMAQALCEGKIIFVMEGGYNLEALSNGVANLARLLLGDSEIEDPLGPPNDGRSEPNITPLIEQLQQIHNLSPHERD